MFIKENKTVRRITAWLCMFAMVLGMMVTGTSPVYAADGRKIDVWDFGCVQESDTATYVNNITVDTITNCANIGANGAFAGGSTAFGDLTLTHNSGDRYFGPVKNYGDNGLATNSYADGYTANGMVYMNGTGGDNRRYFTMANVVAGDKIVVYMTSNNAAEDVLHFDYQGTDGVQADSATYGNKVPGKFEFVAQYSGTYKIWTGTGAKPIYNRIMRVPGVAVTGSIDMGPCTATEYTVKFVNNTTGVETAATVTDGTFSTVLAAGYGYTAMFSGVTGFGFTTASKTVTTTDAECITGKSGVGLVVEAKTIYDYTGSVTGFAADYDLSNLKITMTPDPDANKDPVVLNVAADMTFAAQLEPDVEYTIVMEGVNDYEVVNATTVNDNQNLEQNIEVALKAKQSVTGNFITLDGALDAAVTALTFTNVDDNYAYTATVNGAAYSAELRNGAYLATATVDGYKTTTHVVVEGKAVAKDLLFVSTATPGALERVSDIYVGYADKANNYTTINEAVDAATRMNPTSEAERITIHIAPGTYREQVIINVPYITLTNDEPSEEVLITWYYGIGYVYYSAVTDGYYDVEDAYDKYDKGIANRWGTTVRVNKDAVGFKAENITFEASFNRYITDEEIEDGVEVSGGENITFVRKYGADVTSKAATERATALCAEADNSEFLNCKFYGSQDTLYTGDINGYFKNCFIEGNTDFIFGDNGNVVFDNCELSFYGYSTGSVGGYITAHKPTREVYGYLFRNCTVTANDALTVSPGYWGRPWGADATVTFVNTKLESADLITAAGWYKMNGNPEDANFKEYNTTSLDGTAVDTSGRTVGTVVTENPVSDVTVYFGDDWTPSYYVAEAATVEFATAPYVVDNGDINTPYPGHTLTVGYSLGENDANDASLIQWYSVNGTTETLVKTSTANVDTTYQIQSSDIGNYIKVVVTPITTSGNTGVAASYTVEVAVKDGYEDPSAGGSDVVLGDGVNIFLAGDSTVKDYSANGMWMNGKAQNEGSWGEAIQSFFNEDLVTIVNYANGGRSARNFINEGSLDAIAENIGAGDYLFIQFGHNDCSNGTGYLEDRYVPLGEPDANGVYPVTAGTEVATPSSLQSKYGDTFYSYDCGGTYKWYLLQYINVAKEAGATPVLVTPVARMYYNSDGTIKPHHDSTDTTTNTQVTSNNAYVTAVKQLAEEENVMLLDGYAITAKMYEDAYKADPSAANGVSTYGTQSMHTGEKTHSNKLGGFISAALIAQEIQNRAIDISYAVKMPSQVLAETTSGQSVYFVTGSNKLTAYGIDSDYAEVATYWTTTGQAIIDAIGEKADELAGSTGGDTPVIPPVEPADPVEAFVERMYTVALGRNADAEGVANWTGVLKDGTFDGAAIAQKFILGDEFKLNNNNDEKFVDILYATFFDRSADEAGKGFWMEVLAAGNSREFVLSNFVNSDEFTMICGSYDIQRGVMFENGTTSNPGVTEFVNRLYSLVMGRAADKDGLSIWTLSLTVKAETAESAAKFFFGSEEYILKATDNEKYVKDLYAVFMGREADADGLKFWTDTIAVGMTRDEVLTEFAKSEEFKQIAAGYGL